MSQDQPDPGGAKQDKQDEQNAGAQPGTDAPAPAPAASSLDANPSNTASKSYGDDERPNKARILRIGMDSLYLSFEGVISSAVEFALTEKKHLAQSRRKDEQALAQYPVKGHLFEVRPGRQRLFPYVLEDGAFRIALSSSDSRKLPFAYVKISSDLLAHKGPQAALNELTGILAELASEVEIFPTVSRVDIFADFQTSYDLGELRREAWVSRADGVDSYSREGQFSGWVIGSGSAISARLYNKTLEMAQKRHKSYLLELWQRAGRNADQPVWRLEFQLMREVLDQLSIRTFASLLDKLGGIWGYATQDWLRLAEPQATDTNRGRWPTHPLWTDLASVHWRLDDVPLVRKYAPARVPVEDRLFRLALAVLTSFMAIHGITNFRDGLRMFWEKCEVFHQQRCRESLNTTLEDWVELEVRNKGRLYNSLRNVKDPAKEADTPDEVDSDAIDYTKNSRGE